MAIRNIVKDGDPILRKKARLVEKFDNKLSVIIDDMFETMRSAGGVGLAGNQVGLLRRIAVISLDGKDIELVNPEIIETKGKQIEYEGCLSFPGINERTIRPNKVKVRAFDRNGKEFEVSGEGLLARAFCHEIDHLDGIVFLDRLYNESDKINKIYR